MDPVARAESVLETFAVDVIRAATVKARAHPETLADAVPGLCHGHLPSRDVVVGCAYCARRGNAFAVDDDMPDAAAAGRGPERPAVLASTPTPVPGAPTNDVVAKWSAALLRTLADFAEDVIGALERGTPLRDARARFVAPLRDEVARLDALAAPGVPREDAALMDELEAALLAD